jgi:hypothetical protein
MRLEATSPLSERQRTAAVRGAPTTTVLLAAALLACGDGPTRPPDVIDATDAEIAATNDALTDAATRIVTQLDGTSGSATLQARLTELSSRLASRDPGVVADALARVRSALDEADRTGPAAQSPDRAAVRLTIDAVQRLLD